ncbi:transposase family protein [Candidatus Roizmanbacteria bacterium]|nr:transposase family protein [Candidatus Roizmanbacteria bacterium]
MEDIHIETMEELRAFVGSSQKMVLRIENQEEKYSCIEETVERFGYYQLKKTDKRIVLSYLKQLTGYKHTQLFRLIERCLIGTLTKKTYVRKTAYRRVYTSYDVKLLEATDELHFRLSAGATHEILRREYETFKKKEYEHIAKVSISHINNLRERDSYQSKYLQKTQAVQRAIGETTKPETNNKPGSIRVDTVHQRDVYHINAVDEITQWEVVICVPQISERYLAPALRILLDQFPFVIFNFHSDRGSEFINKVVASILNKILIHQTKSRTKNCNDQALIEGKNGSVIRKNFGYEHLNKEIVDEMNVFFTTLFNRYLNYHRPCGYVTETKVDAKGRERSVYGEYKTPYEKLKELEKAAEKSYLKEEITLEGLDKIAYAMSDNDFAKKVRKEQDRLFELNIFLNHDR